MVITGSSVAVRCGRRLLAGPRTPAIFGPLACRPPARAGPPRRRRPPAWRAEAVAADMTPATWPRGPRGPTSAPTQPHCPERTRAGRLPWGWGSHGLVGAARTCGMHMPGPNSTGFFRKSWYFRRTWILTLRPALFILRRWRVARDGQLTLGYGGPAVRKLARVGFFVAPTQPWDRRRAKIGGPEKFRLIEGNRWSGVRSVVGAKRSSLRSSGRIIG